MLDVDESREASAVGLGDHTYQVGVSSADVVETDAAAMAEHGAAEACECIVECSLPAEDDVVYVNFGGGSVVCADCMAKEGAGSFVEEGWWIAVTDTEEHGSGCVDPVGGAEHVGAELEAGAPQWLDVRAFEEVLHALIFAGRT